MEKTVTQLNMMLVAVVIAIILLLFFLWLFNHMNKQHSQEDLSDDLFDQKQEELNAQLLRLERSECRNLEQRAKISLVNNIMPFIDRIIHELKTPHDDSNNYIRELTDQIEDYNDVLHPAFPHCRLFHTNYPSFAFPPNSWLIFKPSYRSVWSFPPSPVFSSMTSLYIGSSRI